MSSYDSYIFEKASYIPSGLARLAGDLKLLGPTSPAFRQVFAQLNVALRYALRCCCSLTGAEFDAEWVTRIARQGHAYWENVVEPALKAAAEEERLDQDDLAFGLEGSDEAAPIGDWSPDDPEGWKAPPEVTDDVVERARHSSSQRHLDSGTALNAAKTLSALADLADVINAHEWGKHPDAEFRPRLTGALNGATKVVTETLGGAWNHDWPVQVAEHGREALAAILCALDDAGALDRVGREAFDSLSEAWLLDMDPERTPDAEQEAERQRRAGITKENRFFHDLAIPKRYQSIRLDHFLTAQVAGHDICADYAREPKGVLVIHGELLSGLYPIQWAIGRYWFVDQLRSVGAVSWREVVEDNLMAQDQGMWKSPYLLITSLEPVALWSADACADPGYAEKMLEYRLLVGLPTVVTIERHDWETLNLRSTTLELLKAATNVVLPRLNEEDREASGLLD